MTKFLAIAVVIGLLSAGTSWMAVSAAETSRSDCPGKIVCPLTGDEVCADRCPVDTENVPTAPSKTADELCGGACPVPTPKPEKPRDEGYGRSAVAIPASPAPLTGGCRR